METDYTNSDHVFRLRWLEATDQVERCLKTLAAVATQLVKTGGASEADTGSIFVEPLLRGLGWETLNQNEVNRAPRGEFPDYELYVYTGGSAGTSTKRVAVIEVKCLDTHNNRAYFQSTGALGELRKYVDMGPSGTRGKLDQVVVLEGQEAVRGVVTDGRRWHVYDFHGGQKDLVCEFSLHDRSGAGEFLKALGKRQLTRWVSDAARRG